MQTLPGAWFFGVFSLLMCALGVIELANIDQPTYWGTFTASDSQSCRGTKSGGQSCTSIGLWVSDDGTTEKHKIKLDGPLLRDGQTVRAAYRPAGPLGDDTNNIVHAGWTANALLWMLMTWAMAAISGLMAWCLRRWRLDLISRGGER